ncbi:hypothetical protein NIES2119_30680 [[Phormidium ambiguum] IAM M-71]|uniref:Uncharacterized protein n=1 Tax=[Phormidium ambiguum] IAM M-71 TaxID=454136 RepID=A0A1U7I3H4_9CYAN|nr:Rho termination factor N-terminal domain-containing protein [Phormidium ambiguum]OKH30610.1 hypothetical protein NIES2119_30680 [Phormidium ambiguum IAM M-71]
MQFNHFFSKPFGSISAVWNQMIQPVNQKVTWIVRATITDYLLVLMWTLKNLAVLFEKLANQLDLAIKGLFPENLSSPTELIPDSLMLAHQNIKSQMVENQLELPHLFIALVTGQKTLSYVVEPVNYGVFLDFYVRVKNFQKSPECYWKTQSGWLNYFYPLPTNSETLSLVIAQPQTGNNSTAVNSSPVDHQEVLSVPTLVVTGEASRQCSSWLYIQQVCWKTINNLAGAFSAVKASELKQVASYLKIKGYRKMRKLELFLTLIINLPVDLKLTN